MKSEAVIESFRPDAVSVLLLLGVGVLIALMLPLSKIAMSLGMTPLAYAFWQAFGGGLILFVCQGKGRAIGWRGSVARYFGFSALTAIALPNVLAFVVVAQIGSGLTATLYALPSLATYAIALTLRMETLSLGRAMGLLMGIAGCVWILSPSPTGISGETVPWLMLGLLIPLSLAIGNIYRTTHWPRGATAEQLAPGMLLGGAILILVAILIRGEAATLLVGHPTLWGILTIQSMVTAVGYRGFFQLQKRSSPTFLSQLGFVITPAGLLFGILFFNESFGWAVWGGVALLMVGVVLANKPVKSRAITPCINGNRMAE
ncbi:DMT family transporter [Marinobacter lipolyticus]|uniref:DMT family transporter n=1 Tax=Marinobacter lipolyticus TaxID=209639 RepID=UPI003A8E099A